MINFRFHLVSLVAVFLALGIGVIVGSAVIDSAVVDQLRAQQDRLRDRISQVDGENDDLRGELDQLGEVDDALARDGAQRLLVGELRDVPVLLVAVEGTDGGTVKDAIKDTVSQLGTAGAVFQGTMWLTDRFLLDDDGERKDLATTVGLAETSDAAALRTATVTNIASALRLRTPEAIDDPALGVLFLETLRERGFLDIDAPSGRPDDSMPQLSPGTRVLLVSGASPSTADEMLAVPLATQLVAARPDRFTVPLVAATVALPDGGAAPSVVTALRSDEGVTRGRLSTVDNLGMFAGRLAAVLALSDLGAARFGHFGLGPGAQRLLPAPPLA